MGRASRQRLKSLMNIRDDWKFPPAVVVFTPETPTRSRSGESIRVRAPKRRRIRTRFVHEPWSRASRSQDNARRAWRLAAPSGRIGPLAAVDPTAHEPAEITMKCVAFHLVVSS